MTPRRPDIEHARQVLRRHFGYDDFRPGQVDIVSSVVAGRDTLAVLPTGGGKSLCYQVPALTLSGMTVVISPLISLMKDQVDRLIGRGIAAAVLNSTLDAAQTAALRRRVARGDIKLLYLAPERFASDDLRQPLRASGITLIAVDEAHCISEWGHDFRPSFRRIADIAAAYNSPQIVALTATATPAVRRDIVRQLRLRAPRVIVGGFDRSNLHYAVRHCRDDAEKTRQLASIIRSSAYPAVVYAPTRASVVSVAKRLDGSGCRTAPYHAGLDERARHETQDAFMRGHLDVIVATNAFGMGVDKPDVRLVVHFSIPRTLESYYQEAGRAGRDGSRAHCILLYADADRGIHENFISATFPERTKIEALYARLSAQRKTDGIAPGCDAQMSFLVRHGAVTQRRCRGKLVRVQVTASPEQIARALGTPADAEDLVVLRALWRQGSSARRWERTVDLGALDAAIPWQRANHSLERLRQRRLLHFIATDGGFEPARPGAPLAECVDWDAVARRRACELERLALMQGYARTRRCRRAFVLRYFGQKRTARNCGGCDNCERTRSRTVWEFFGALLEPRSGSSGL